MTRRTPIVTSTAARQQAARTPLTQGYLMLLLHCHLPFVRHPEHEWFLEEDWLYEAVVESYLPLLDLLEKLQQDGAPCRVTLCLSPTLCEMLSDTLLQQRCLRYMQNRLELSEREVRAKRNTPFHESALMYRRIFQHSHDRFRELSGRGMLKAFGRLQKEGRIEILTTAATHALLPLLATREAVHAQIEMGCRTYERHFGARPRGMWLPECAYQEGLDEAMRRCGIEYFFLESHGLLLADPRPTHGVFAPILTQGGLAAFARDIESSRQVWSSTQGYPGDPNYREFHRDLGYDADLDYIRPYLHPDGFRHNLGIKYHRITGKTPLDRKEPYRPGPALDKAREHAAHFVSARTAQAERLCPLLGRPPIIVCPYDAELFGHWWFEGPQFLQAVLEKAGEGKSGLRFVTAPEYLAENPIQQVCAPAASSWGFEGYFEVWVNGSNDWIWRHLHMAEETMVGLVREFAKADGLRARALNQCARELMLAQSSDWPFLMSVRSAPTYARARIEQHVCRFQQLAEQIRSGDINTRELARIEALDNIFQNVDYHLYEPRA